MRLFKFTIVSLLLFILSISTGWAQDGDPAGPATFVGSITLWLAAAIGTIASVVTLVYAYRLQGGLVGQALILIGIGMLLVVLGFIAVVVSWTDAQVQAVVHDIAFIIGYLMMLAGALRLRKIA